MNIIDERDTRTIHRKIRKKEYDNIMTLAVSDTGQKVRLLDEGAVVMADGSIDFYIKKGTIRKYVDSLDETYEGSINLGHMPFAQFPILLGKWTKSDLSIVDIGDGREALDVNLRLDEDNSLVKDMRRADYDLAVSAEFTYHADQEASEKFGFLIVDDIFITDFAIVGEPGNVNSAGIKLKGGPKVTLNELSDLIENEKAKTAEPVPEEPIELAVSDDPVEEPKEELSVETEEGTVVLFPEGISEEEAKALEVDETPEEEPVEEPKEELDVENEVPKEEMEYGLMRLAGVVEQLSEQNKALTEQNAELVSKVDDLSKRLEEAIAKLSAKEAEEKAFCDKFKNLYVSVGGERKKPDNNAPIFTDGIGD